jgi:hypothetical protein
MTDPGLECEKRTRIAGDPWRRCENCTRAGGEGLGPKVSPRDQSDADSTARGTSVAVSPPMTYLQILTTSEKHELSDRFVREAVLDQVDLSGADFRGSHLEVVSLRGCTLRGADLRGAVLLRCDLREADLRDVMLGRNRFDGSWFAGASGLTDDQIQDISRCGGTFVASGECPTAGLEK